MTPLRLSALLGACTLILTAACGRSSLGIGPGPVADGGSGGGSGGNGATGGTGPTTGGGGEGGLPADCSVLEVEGPIGVAGGMMAHQRQPALVALNDSEVVLAMEWTDANFGNAPQELRHTLFAPWGEPFPTADAAPSFLADFDKGTSFDATTSTQGRFALLMSAGPFSDMTFNPFFIPGDGAVPPGLSLPSVERVAFVDHDGQGNFLVGVTDAPGPGPVNLLTVGVFTVTGDDQITMTLPPQTVGCASSPIGADAQWTGERWIIVAGTAEPGTCMPAGPPPGPATFIRSYAVEPFGGGVVVGPAEPTNPIDTVDLALTEAGAVAVWTGPGDNFGGPIFAWRLDDFGFPLAPSDALPGVEPTVVPGAWAAGSFGEGMLLSWRSGSDGALHARRLSSQLEPLGQATLPTPTGAVGRPDVLGDPAGSPSALVAQPVFGNQAEQLRIFRLGCP